MSYSNVLFVALETRHNNISKLFIQGICKPNSCLPSYSTCARYLCYH